MSTLSTHILDISTGTPAEGVTVSLSREGETLANLVTNAQGRIATFSAAPLPAGRYCLTAETGAWFARAGRESVFTRAQIDFVIGEAAEDHFHLPFRSGERQPVGPVRRSRHRACTGGSGDHPSCFIPTQG